MEHKAYIDSLRGFAIWVVVIGHCCEFGLGHNDTLFNYMYFSFHMPLFMFISGLVSFHRPDYKFLSFFKSKVYRLLIPFVIVGSLSCLARGIPVSDLFEDFAKKGYWFLPVLFFILLLMFPAYKLSNLLNKTNNLLKDIIIYLIPLIVISCCYKLFTDYLNGLLSTKYIIKLYPFALIGLLTTKYHIIETYLHKDLIECSLIILSVISFIAIYHVKGPISIAGFFIVPIIYSLFKENKLLGELYIFNKLGGVTLQIYVLHYFMIPSIKDLSKIIDSQQGQWLASDNWVLYAFISVILAVIVIAFTLCVIKIIEISPSLNFILFGFKNKKKDV